MNNKKLGYGILAALFVLFHVIAFAIPVNRSSAFWVAYVFTVVSFAVQIIIWNNAFPKDGKDVFLGIPIVRIGVYYLLIQCIAFLIFMFIPSAPVWIPIIVCTAVCCVVCVILLSTNVARNEVTRVGSKVKEYTDYAINKFSDENKQELDILNKAYKSPQCVKNEKALCISGNDIIALGVPQGRKIGMILSSLLEAVQDGKVDNEKEQLINYVKNNLLH